MYSFLTGLFSILLTILLFSIISIIPVDFIRKDMIEKGKNLGIQINNRNAWNFNLLNLSFSTTDVELKLPIKNSHNNKTYDMMSRVEKLSVPIIGNNITINNAIIIIKVHDELESENFDILNVIQSINEFYKDFKYNIECKNLIIQILITNKDSEKDNKEYVVIKNKIENYNNLSLIQSKQGANIGKLKIKEFAFAKLQFQKNIEFFQTTGLINILDKKLDFKILTKFPKKIQNNDKFIVNDNKAEKFLYLKMDYLNCNIYIQDNNGQTKCSTSNITKLLKDFGYTNDNDYFKFIKNKSISLNGNINIISELYALVGKLSIGNDIFDIGMKETGDRNGEYLINIKSDKLNLKEIINNDNDNDNDINNDEQKIENNLHNSNEIMKNKQNNNENYIKKENNRKNEVHAKSLESNDKIIANRKQLIKKNQSQQQDNKFKIYEDNPWLSSINNNNNQFFISGGDEIIYVIKKFFETINFNIKIKINNIIFDKFSGNNLFVNITKQANDYIINDINFKFDTDDILTIKKNNESRFSDIKISGNTFNAFLELFNIEIFSKDLYNKPYNVIGSINLINNQINLENLKIFISNNEFLTFNYNTLIDNNNVNQINQNILIKNVKLEEILNFNLIWTKLYESFLDSQKHTEQNTIIQLFFNQNQHLQLLNKNIFNNIFNIQFKDSSYYDFKIDNLAITVQNFQDLDKISINSHANYLHGSMELLKDVIDDISPVMQSNIKINLLDDKLFDILLNDFKVNNNLVSQKIIQDKDYNIPSFAGLSGDLKINIDNIQHDNKINYKNLQCLIKLYDGIFNIQNCKVQYNQINGGDIALNGLFDLTYTPSLDISFATSGVPIDSFVNNIFNGFITLQGKFYTSGFNFYDWIRKGNGNMRFIINNFMIQNFDLTNLSQSIIGEKNITIENYKDVIRNGNLIFQNSNGVIKVNDGKVNGNFEATKNLISTALNYEIDILNYTINYLNGSFIVLGKNYNTNKDKDIVPIYIPIALNGKLWNFTTIINYDNLEKYLFSVPK